MIGLKDKIKKYGKYAGAYIVFSTALKVGVGLYFFYFINKKNQIK